MFLPVKKSSIGSSALYNQPAGLIRLFKAEISPAHGLQQVLPHLFDVSIEELPAGSFTLLDVRESNEQMIGRNAVSLPYSDLDRVTGSWILPRPGWWCESGLRSRAVTAWLRSKGFERVFSLKGGLANCKASIVSNLSHHESVGKKKVSLFVKVPSIPNSSLLRSRSIRRRPVSGRMRSSLGQIRADKKGTETVEAIEFSAYREMADTAYQEFREQLFARHSITCMHVYHSLGGACRS